MAVGASSLFLPRCVSCLCICARLTGCAQAAYRKPEWDFCDQRLLNTLFAQYTFKYNVVYEYSHCVTVSQPVDGPVLASLLIVQFGPVKSLPGGNVHVIEC